MDMPGRRIVGIQLHHSTFLDDATRGAANMVAGLTAALGRTGSAELEALLAEARVLVRRVGDAHAEAQANLRALHTDPDFVRYREGELPWPDERAEGFVARCSCNDRCLFHDIGRGSWEDDCNCGPCPQHS